MDDRRKAAAERVVREVKRRSMPRTLKVFLTEEGRTAVPQTEEKIREGWHSILGVPRGTPVELADLVIEYVRAEAAESIPTESTTPDLDEAIAWILLGRIAAIALPHVRRYRSRVALLALALVSPAARALLKHDNSPLPAECPDLSTLRRGITTGAGLACPVETLRAAWSWGSHPPVVSTETVRAGRKRGGLRDDVRLAIRTASGKRVTLQNLALALKKSKEPVRKAADHVVRHRSGEFGKETNDDGPIYFVRDASPK